MPVLAQRVIENPEKPPAKNAGRVLKLQKVWQIDATDEKKGGLWDVFDFDGHYLDCFYLGLQGSFLGVKGDEIFAVEKAPDVKIALVKYKIVE